MRPLTAVGVFSDGLDSQRVQQYESRLRTFARKEIASLGEAAEAACAFPAEIIRALGSHGILRERWSPEPYGDVGQAVLISEAVSGAGFGGIAAGVSLHTEVVISMLVRFGRSDYLRRLLNDSLSGTSVGCVGMTESVGGSDLNGIHTTLTPAGHGRWHLRGTKKYVSLAPVADFALVLARMHSEDNGGATRFAVVAVPRQDMRVGEQLTRVGVHSLSTAPVQFDTEIGEEAFLGPPGAGILVATHGLSHERLAVAAVSVGLAQLAIDLAATHLRRRVQFGVPLCEHQALRLRLAELAAITETLRAAVRGVAHTASVQGHLNPRTAAAVKVTAARQNGHVVSECMHLFGGPGYLEDETPLARMWRDIRVARLGAGTDEMMWEIVSGGVTGDDDLYDSLVALS
jgi:acyl-ACP dehydrogenase